LVNCGINDAGHHSDFVSVVLVLSALHGEGHRDKRRRRLVKIIDSNYTVFGVCEFNFVFTPRASVIANLLEVFDGQPARTLNFTLENEEFKHTLVSSKHTFESVS
jgi:hypothetical protein